MRIIAALVVSTLLLNACGEPTPGVTPKNGDSVTTAPASSTAADLNPDALEDAITNYFKAFNDYQWEKMAGYYADSALFLDPEFGTEYVKKSKSDIITKYAAMQKMMPGLKDSVVNIVAAGNMVVAEFVSSGTMAEGRWTLPICTVFTFENGKIVSDATYYDIPKE